MKAFLIILLFCLSAEAQSLKPGVWKGKVSFKLDGIPLPATEDEDCILPGEAKDVKSSITKNLEKKGCKITRWDVKGQELDAALTCDSDEIKAKGKIKGRFDKTSYNLKGKASGKYRNMLPTVASVEMNGQWLKSCDEPEKKTN